MIRWLVSRGIYAVAVLVGAASVVFVLIHIAGDPVAALVPPGSSPEQLEQLRRAYGLDRPLVEQYVIFLRDAARFDFGESWRQGRPALDAVLERLPATLLLAGAAAVVAVVGGGVLGLIAGARIGKPTDWLARTVMLAGQAMPGFLLGSTLIALFAVRLHWLPSSGFDGPLSLVLPVIALAAAPAATIARLVRAGVAVSLAAEYVQTARGKGLPARQILVGHVLRNAVLPAVAFAGFQATFLISGATVIEAVFAFPGMGSLALGAVSSRDLPVIQAFVAVVAVLLIAINFLVDLVLVWLDPRQRDASRAAFAGGTA